MGIVSLLPPLFAVSAFLLVLRMLLSREPRTPAPRRPFPYRTLLLALSGTLGVGNITGVAAAILIGGAGSVLWMLVSALFAIVLKYRESTLSYRSGGVGMMRALEPLPLGRALAPLWACLALALAFVMGGALQSRAAVGALVTHLDLPGIPVALALSLLVLVLVRRGAETVASRLAVTLPLATAVYVALCLAVILSHRSALGAVLRAILDGAFSGEGVLGGTVGTLTSEALRRGTFAGLLSNEAGAGTSTLARHPECDERGAGRIGILEVVFDTLVLCPLSALAFLLGAPDGAATPSELCRVAFSSVLGNAYSVPLSLAIFLFALSTVLCWFVYATRLLSYMKKGAEKLSLLFVLCIFVGGLVPELWLISLSDLLLFFLSLLCLYALHLSPIRQASPRTMIDNLDPNSQNFQIHLQ